jgi:hypothetical protein
MSGAGSAGAAGHRAAPMHDWRSLNESQAQWLRASVALVAAAAAALKDKALL